MTLSPSLQFLSRLREVATTDIFRGRMQHHAEGTIPTFQLLIDVFLLETSTRRGFAVWSAPQSSHNFPQSAAAQMAIPPFLGCAMSSERGISGSAWAPVSHGVASNSSRQLSPTTLGATDHCRFPLEYHFPVDFPHAMRATVAFLADRTSSESLTVRPVKSHRVRSTRKAWRQVRRSLLNGTAEWLCRTGQMCQPPKVVHWPGRSRKPWQRWVRVSRSPWDEAWWAVHQAMCKASKVPCRMTCATQ
mmetsp:Transcript_87102/g.281239  ORF Transcript_87102/g.281239 Transcript_87102/m.281239 type:complete len:246 (+) Transcript_87102:3-740(+)